MTDSLDITLRERFDAQADSPLNDVPTQDWSDVLRRSHHHTRLGASASRLHLPKPGRAIGLGLVLVALMIPLGALAHQYFYSYHTVLHEPGQRIAPAGLSSQDRLTIQSMGRGSAVSIHRIATISQRNFYRILLTDGQTCVASGTTGETTPPVPFLFETMTCPLRGMRTIFQGANNHPVQLSIDLGDRVAPTSEYSLEGFTSNPVKRLTVVESTGQTITVPSRHHAFYLYPLPHTATRLIAYAANGHVLQTVPLGFGLPPSSRPPS